MIDNTKFCGLRDEIIEKEYSRMNNMQFQAVTTTEGPLLVLAGAGSGKTTVLVNRIAYLLKFGNAYKSGRCGYYTEEDIERSYQYLNGSEPFYCNGFGVDAAKPWEILAITFTNKAAGELKDRIALMVGSDSNDIWAGTFHSVCGKILRRYGERLGYSNSFTIYDTDDQKRLIKDIMKNLSIDEKVLSARNIMSAISHAKDKLIEPEQYIAEAGIDMRLKTIGMVYERYRDALKRSDAMDFDDMIVLTVKLFSENPDVLDYYANKFRYIMVDEYQDTNYAQYILVRQLASIHRNICVVGDDDQSIYRFRGATIENILNFEDEYTNSKVIRLEQNYRSTSTILDAANAVISNNVGRKGKTLWTDNGKGKNIDVYVSADDRGESRFVTDGILESVRNGAKFSDNAVLYRMNAQSRSLENYFARSGIPYRIIGGHRFFERKEIKDVISYLSVVANTSDEIRLKRIINEPKRGIGAASVETASQIAGSLGIPLFEVIKNAEDYPALSRAAGKFKEFSIMIDNFVDASAELPLDKLLAKILDESGYVAYLQSLGKEEIDRLENVNELLSSIQQYMEDDDDASLAGYLEEVALISDIDSYDSDADAVVLMTIHSAKGLEFPEVYLIGMEEGIFPSNQTVYGNNEDVEEERRLAYVAITRAKKVLHISRADSRVLFGSTQRNLPSRFLTEIPDELCDIKEETPFRSFTASGSYQSSYSFSAGKTTTTSSNSYKKPIPNYSKPVQATVPTTSFNVGDKVLHKVFGVGVIVAVTKMSTDQMLEIDFEKVGNKKLMANFAKLTKV